MKKGDDAFNARDFAAADEVHHPDMIAYITGSADLIYGREAHTEAMQQLLRMFPRHTREQRPLPDPVRQRRLDHRRHQRHRDLHRRDDPAGRRRDPPDRKKWDVEFGQTTKWHGDQLIVISAFWDAALLRNRIGLV
jgi:hypothetical protein